MGRITMRNGYRATNDWAIIAERPYYSGRKPDVVTRRIWLDENGNEYVRICGEMYRVSGYIGNGDFAIGILRDCK